MSKQLSKIMIQLISLRILIIFLGLKMIGGFCLYGQNLNGCVESPVHLHLKGLNIWEKYQAKICPDVYIDPIRNNSFIEQKRIWRVILFEDHYLENDIKKTIQKYIWEYEKDGNLVNTNTNFILDQNDSLVAAHITRYKYNSEGLLCGMLKVQNAVYDGNEYFDHCSSFPDKLIHRYNKKGTLETIQFNSSFQNCLTNIIVNDSGLVKEINVLFEGKLVHSIRFVYTFW